VSLRGKAAETPEPKGKLDTMNGIPDAVASAPVPVNGPEDGFPDWDQVDWGQAEENVRRLRRRIFAASQAGDLKKVRNLQKLMLRSRSNALVSVRRVTEFNAILDRVARNNSQTVTVVDLNKALDPNGKFQVIVDGTAVRWPDGIHISKPGGEWLQPFVLTTVAQLGLIARGAGS